ncbi:GH36-type glycosyl hydrolase domain-containing protein [Candidatus Clostridium radicumherbarum]|uniref:GH36-type glycosyl hydrolase domain-containing protein n=1 Tax=Candidatus Clostridium radicumherbarum TaxID=3381662 RepID=A0ABW8TVN6_9CLOT
MFYVYTTAVIFIGLFILYILIRNRDIDEHNLMEDVPTISINKEELERHALEISQYYSDVLKKSNCKRKLIKSLDKSYEQIIKTYEYIDKQVKNNNEIVPAAEWMLDNLYLIEKEYKDIKHNMPAAYYKGLPIIKRGIMKGYPRAYHIAVELISHSDGRLDEDTIEGFINAYQKNTILLMGELWALPIMIRIALIQNISKISENIIYTEEEKLKGELLADRLITAVNSGKLEEELNKLEESEISFNSHLTESFIKVLRDNGVDNSDIYSWLDKRLEVKETTAEKIINTEHQKQAHFQISMGNSITSIREVVALNWWEIFERLSFVEKELRKDPLGTYEDMDFESRDNYRHRVEKIAKHSNNSEAYVAKKAMECAEKPETHEDYVRHVGYYLIDEGIEDLKKLINYKDWGFGSFGRFIKKKKINFYIGNIILCTVLLCFLVILIGDYELRLPIYSWRFAAAFFAVLIPCSEIVISIFNWSINHLITPKFVPKLDFKEGIPDSSRTVVVIPTLLSSVKRVYELINDMEVYFLANHEKNLYLALLGDFKDSAKEHEENDNEINEAALKAIKELNRKYAGENGDIFYFFNRFRQFNEKEGIWLGYERKRGKLMEFNALLRGDNTTSYNVISGDLTELLKVKYVITLDADTKLTRDTAKRLIGAMSHVLNRPYIDYDKKCILRGNGLMQPRISVGTLAANKTMFSKVFSGETGIDIYTTAVSDVYQDLFGEGIFTGKGIYDVDVFNFMLMDEVPDNTVLSHDLLEGSYVRAALVSDIELMDGYPAFYNSSSMRLHRWVRGDWQILRWITKKSPLDLLSRWKIVDNLRRSLLAPSIIILIILSFTILPKGETWNIVAFLAVLCPILFDVSESVVSPIKGISLSGRVNTGKLAIEQVFLIFCFLPYQAYLMLDAIIRTLYRLLISKKKLLEWQTAADVEAKLGKNMNNFINSMWPGSLIAIIIEILAFRVSLESGLLTIPSTFLWFLSPIIAYYISKELKAKEYTLKEEEVKLLRKLSRKTWAYFEDFVNAENNYLAPDNYQEAPPNGVAHRTSPTNMGMGLTSNLAAYDLGYIGIIEFTERLDNIITSMESLKGYKGHFYNWYDTITKEPLYPRYVSTVDSGNLVGYLWVTSESLGEYVHEPVITVEKIQGIVDNIYLCEEELKHKNFYTEIIEASKNINLDLISWKRFLLSVLDKINEAEGLKDYEGAYWTPKLKASINNYLNEIERFFPWATGINDKVGDHGENILADGLKLTERLISLPVIVPLNDIPCEIDKLFKEIKDSSDKNSKAKIRSLLENSKEEAVKLLEKINALKSRLNLMADGTDFKMLYSKKRQLFSIGYDVEKDTLGNSYYDLLASEARQASFIAIAKGDVEQKHWFKLNRAMTIMGKSKGLVSWSGTMFEYFMPLLIMKNYPDTLLNETYLAVIEGQKNYCSSRKIPWGISESAFYTFDPAQNYQYKAFGVPGIGLKRGLSNELVVSPYSTILTLQIDLLGSMDNIKRLITEGLEGRYGFYEAVDYTKERMPNGKAKALIKNFMVHHEGMSLMSLDNVLNGNTLRERFHRIPNVKATELLLQERISNKIVYDREQQFDSLSTNHNNHNIAFRSFKTAKTDMPEAHLLSNGSYSLMITNSGSGYGKLEDMTAYRWREDVTLDNTGLFFYIKNLNSNEYWSSSYEPVRKEGESYEAVFSLDKAEFIRKDGSIDTHTEIAVSQEDNAEVRRITLTNHSQHSRTLEITSYCEVTLAPLNADIVHPTFSNLFIRTEYIDNPCCLIANRRPRAKGQKKPHLVQTCAVFGESIGTVQYETNRENFLGRCRNIEAPEAMDNETVLKNTVGAVLDPILSIRKRVKIKPGETVKVAYTTAVCETREESIELAKKYNEYNNINRVFELAWTQTQVEMNYLGIKSTQANLYQLMASKILFLNPNLREREAFIKNIKKAQPALWPYGISGDLPIVLVLIRNEVDLDTIKQVLHAHEYWSIKGLKIDIVIVNIQNTIYLQPLQDSIRDILASGHLRDKQNKPGGVFLHSKTTMAAEDIDLLRAIARLVIDSEKGSLLQQINGASEIEDEMQKLVVKEQSYNILPYNYEVPDLMFFNGLGGFNVETEEYTIILKDYKNTPAPWINVISNKDFGFHISESGVSYTWNKNSRENKLTAWSNDPVTDPITEAVYIRDEETGDIWGITPKPKRDEGEYIIKHGFGYSNFVHEAKGIIGEMTAFVPLYESVKLCLIKLKNNTKEERQLSLTYYAQLTLGVYPQQTAQYISTYLEENKDFIYGQNPYSEHFGKGFCYLKIAGGEEVSFTGSRTEFMGRCGSIENPQALSYNALSNKVGSGYDPCLTANSKVRLSSGEEVNLVIMLGEHEDLEHIKAITKTYEDFEVASGELTRVKEYWKELLHRIQVKTPDKTMDLMLNGWLIYQTLSCRFWSRTGFYQSGGAIGFRDQLQDSMALGYLKPEITKEQILQSSTRQFLEGDVQHWWHPVVNSGIRTRFSDDLLWMPYVTIDYIKNTGDYSILDEETTYLEEEPLKEGEDERYKVTLPSDKKGSIYEHCIKAIDVSLKFGIHNIPLMGSGDWNDGMSTVGNKGKGESVWLGWFLYSILDGFKDLCKYKKDDERAEKYDEMQNFLAVNLEKNAWDGGWYRRAYFDDGTPLGSMENDECQIDSLSQSWSVISGAARQGRREVAMEALERNLVKEDKGIVLLLTPAFNNSKLEPGYIKGYVPGVRENGGQYTHAATWVALAMAKLGYGNKAWKIYHMINPINHTKSYLDCLRYKVEPYVITADVYNTVGHEGRGGWSWYTGSSSWMYRVGIEGILGLKLKGDKGFTIEPSVPKEWKEYELNFKKDNCSYNILVKRGDKNELYVDGKLIEQELIPHFEEGEHKVEVIIN